jgi:hypothetical protein
MRIDKMNEDIEKLKMITRESDEELLSFLLENAERFILSYTNRTELTYPLEPIKINLAVIYYNRLGTEGETSRNEGGISVSFCDAPKEIYDVLNKYRLVRVGGYAFEQKKT